MESKDLIIPHLDVNDDKVTIENLRFSNLDHVSVGDVLYTVSTSKSVEDYEVDFSGYIVYFVGDGDDVKIGESAGMIFKDLHEANLLMLDCSKANKFLKWKSVWGVEETFEKTINWYKQFYENGTINTESDLKEFITSAKNKNLIWTK